MDKITSNVAAELLKLTDTLDSAGNFRGRANGWLEACRTLYFIIAPGLKAPQQDLGNLVPYIGKVTPPHIKLYPDMADLVHRNFLMLEMDHFYSHVTVALMLEHNIPEHYAIKVVQYLMKHRDHIRLALTYGPDEYKAGKMMRLINNYMFGCLDRLIGPGSQDKVVVRSSAVLHGIAEKVTPIYMNVDQLYYHGAIGDVIPNPTYPFSISKMSVGIFYKKFKYIVIDSEGKETIKGFKKYENPNQIPLSLG